MLDRGSPDLPDSEDSTEQKEVRIEVPITVLGQYIKDLSFEIPKAPHHLQQNQKPQIKVNFDIGSHSIEEGVYEVFIKAHVKTTSEDMTIYLIDLVYASVLSVKGLPSQHQKTGAIIEGARLLFPFVRSLLMVLTREGGFSPLMINPIDFNELYRRYREKKEETETITISPTTSDKNRNGSGIN